MPELSARKLRRLLTPASSDEGPRLVAELEDLLRSSTEPCLYFGAEPDSSWVILWRELGGSDYQLAIALPTEDSGPVESHISRVLLAGIGEDLVDPEDDVVLVDWESSDVTDGSDAEVAAFLSLAVITGYEPAEDLGACHWTGPQHSPEQLDELRAWLAKLVVPHE